MSTSHLKVEPEVTWNTHDATANPPTFHHKRYSPQIPVIPLPLDAMYLLAIAVSASVFCQFDNKGKMTDLVVFVVKVRGTQICYFRLTCRISKML